LEFIHPQTAKRISFESALPEDMADIINKSREQT